MAIYFDRQETQSPKSRDAALFRDLKGILSFAKGRAPTLRDQLRGVDLNKVRTRADLARIPLLRKSDLPRLQFERPPLGGLAARNAGALKGILIAPGPVCLPEGLAKDWWRAARAMHAAGVERGDVILNGFCFDVGAGARIVESGAYALGCAVAHCCENNVEWSVDALLRLGAAVYCGPAKRLEHLIAAHQKRKLGAFPIRKALCFDGAPDAAREERFRRSGVDVHACYATDELGVIAYDAKQLDGARADDLIVNEGLIVEIVKPGTDEPLPFGSVGEIVVTRLNSEFPLLRFATGDLSSLLPGPSPCGRTNLRLHKLLGRVETRKKETRSRPSAPRIEIAVLPATASRAGEPPIAPSWTADA